MTHPPTLAAIGGASALTGDTVRVGETTFRIRKVTCPDPATDAGRDAKALANTALKIEGRMSCQSMNGVGDCTIKTVDGQRNLSDIMRNTKYCR